VDEHRTGADEIGSLEGPYGGIGHQRASVSLSLK
jgi:hypothetical protein